MPKEMANVEVRLNSDATIVPQLGAHILIHVLSDALTWGLGFTQAIEARWPNSARSLESRLRHTSQRPNLGDVLWTKLEERMSLASLIVERSRGNPKTSLDLEAFSQSLGQVADLALKTTSVVHAPPIGTGLSGATWKEVHATLQSALGARGVIVVVHCLGNRPPE